MSTRQTWIWIKRNPWLSAFTALVVVAIGAGTASGTYALWIQPDPQILSQPMSYQREPAPIPNTGQDAAGRSLDQWLAAGGAPKDFQPVRKTMFKPGESLWILRYECFLNKTQEGIVSRAFLGGDGSQGTTGSVYMLPDVQIPNRTDGCSVKNHRTPIPVDLLPGQWRYQASVNFYKSPIQPSVRVLFKPVLIEVVKGP